MAGKRLKVLHVEDDFADALLVQNAVCEAGDFDIAFTVARTLKEARRRLKSGIYDLVLLDLRLPDSLNPKETIGAVTALSGDIPVLVLSGSTRIDAEALPDGVKWLDKNEHFTVDGGGAPIHLAGFIRQTAMSHNVQAI
ncbi:MAG: response regulator [Maricaulaceae bacterium]|nr:response regulator [Maricaulaceae bacterium]